MMQPRVCLAAVVASLFLVLHEGRADRNFTTAVMTQDDVRFATLLTAHGQQFIGNGAGQFVRSMGGEFAEVLTNAQQTGLGLWAATPRGLFAWRDKQWTIVKLRHDGPALLGTGPSPSVAVGRQILVHDGTSWQRVGTVTSAPVALWAASQRDVVVLTRDAAFRLRGSKWQRIPIGLGLAITGAPTRGPNASVSAERASATMTHLDDLWLVGEVGATQLRSRQKVPGRIVKSSQLGPPWIALGPETEPSPPGVAVPTNLLAPAPPSTTSTPLATTSLVASGVPTWSLLRLDTNERVAPPNLPVEQLTTILGDSAGRILLVTNDVAYLYDGAWHAAVFTDALPSGSGPGPAPTK